jgi:DNA-binding response OmpR family regulator
MSVRVLLADTDESLLKEYGDFLTGLGMEVATAADGKDCLAKLRSFTPDMLVLEPHLPGGGGERVLSDLRDECDGDHISVLLLSTKEVDEKLHKAGYTISDYDTKPLKPYFLADRILRILAKKAGVLANSAASETVSAHVNYAEGVTPRTSGASLRERAKISM